MIMIGPSKMLLPKLKLHFLRRRTRGSFTDLSSRRVGPAKVHSNLGSQGSMQPRHVRLIMQTISHSRKQAGKIRAAKVGATAQLRQRVNILAHRVEVDVGGRVGIQTLGEVRVDAQELGAALAGSCRRGLGL